MSETETPAAAPQRSKRPLILLIVAAVLVVSGGAGGAYWYLRRPAAAAEKPAHAPAAAHGLLSLEPFVVNLADPSGTRFLRATIQLIVEDEADVEHLRKTPVALMQARGAILELLTVQTAATLVTMEGKTALKKTIAERASTALNGTKVLDVLFSDFVVQF